MEQFVNRKTQNGKVDFSDPLECPVDGVFSDFGIDRFYVGNGTMDELFGEGVIITGLILLLDEDTYCIIELFRLVELPLIEELHRAHSVFTALRCAFYWFCIVFHFLVNCAISRAA